MISVNSLMSAVTVYLLATTRSISADNVEYDVKIGFVGNYVILLCNTTTVLRTTAEKITAWKAEMKPDKWSLVAGRHSDGTSVASPAFKGRVQIMAAGSGLKISNLRLQDSANYMCEQKVQQGGNPQYTFYRLIVIYPPEIRGTSRTNHYHKIRGTKTPTNTSDNKTNKGHKLQTSAGLVFLAVPLVICLQKTR